MPPPSCSCRLRLPRVHESGMNPRRMLIGIGVGAAAGLAANALFSGAPWLDWLIANITTPVGQIFLRALFMLVIPLLFSALVVGVVGIDLRDLGGLGGRTLAFTVVVSFIAVMLGLLLVNVIRPGAGVSEAVRELAHKGRGISAAAAPAGQTVAETIVAMVPDNPIKAAADGNMIGVIVFALVIGVAMAVTRTEPAGRLRDAVQGIYDVMMTCIEGV